MMSEAFIPALSAVEPGDTENTPTPPFMAEPRTTSKPNVSCKWTMSSGPTHSPDAEADSMRIGTPVWLVLVKKSCLPSFAHCSLRLLCAICAAHPLRMHDPTTPKTKHLFT